MSNFASSEQLKRKVRAAQLTEPQLKKEDPFMWQSIYGNKPTPAPTVGQAITGTAGQIDADMKRRRQSQTLFTSGQGVLDSPLIASALLLGS